jgi:hypothetical protein
MDGVQSRRKSYCVKTKGGLVSSKEVKEGNLSRQCNPRKKSLQDNTLLFLLLSRSPGIGGSAWF